MAKDEVEAVKWLLRAAEQGQAVAQSTLGICYCSGQGVTKDYVEAVKWLRKAAEQGNDVAQTVLGDRYCNGEGVAKDYVEAYKWSLLASAQGMDVAKKENCEPAGTYNDTGADCRGTKAGKELQAASGAPLRCGAITHGASWRQPVENERGVARECD